MEDKQRYIASILRGVLIALCAVFLYIITTLTVWMFAATNNSLLEEIDLYVICILCTATIPFIFNSFARAFAYSDRRCIEEFAERDDKKVSFSGEMKAVFSSRETVCELIATHVTVAIVALVGGFISVEKMFEGGMPVGNWVVALILIPLCFALSLLAKYEAARLHAKLYRDNDIEKMMTPKWLILRIIILTALYPFATPLSPILAYGAITVFSILAKFSSILTTLGLILIIIAFIFAAWGIKVLLCMRRRKKFIKRLFTVAKENGYTIKDFKNPYRSFVTAKNHCSFSLIIGEKEFECIVLSTLWHGASLVFTSPTDAYLAHRLGTKNHYYTLRHNIEFYHRTSAKKIVIVNPVPRDVFLEDGGKEVRVHCSDVIWQIAVHDGDSFIGCADRKCL